MNRRSANWLSALVVFVSAGLFLAQTSVLLAAPDGAKKPPGSKPIERTLTAVHVGISKPMRDMKLAVREPRDPHNLREVEPEGGFERKQEQFPNATKPHDPLVQRQKGAGLIPAPLLSFDGVGDVNGVQPADMGLDVSDNATNQIFQWVNLSWEIFDKSGNPLGGPFPGTSFWSGLPGSACQTFNGGDILVRWDQFASQWVVAQLAYPGPNHICVAVSTTSDALGTYYQYDYTWGNDFPDYPKFAMWPDSTNNGYYFTIRNFGATFAMEIMAVDRAAILTGTPGTPQVFNAGAFITTGNLDGLEPADLRGLDQPPTGSLETYIAPGHPNTDGSPGPVVHLFQTFTDFSNPANSFINQLPDIAVADFDPGLPGGAPQVGGGTLETLQQFGQNGIQYRADYRVFTNSDGSINHDSLLLLHDVNVGGSNVCGGNEQGGERWHEVQHVVDGLGSPTLYQEGTYGPCDNTYRWMGSLAQDASGDLALGFSATSGGSGIVSDPSVHYTGRLVGDPLGTMPQGEGSFLDSTQAFSGFRWGDYSNMVVDPEDQCTFYYSAMYGAGDWKTRIGSFMFPTCSNGPSGTLTGVVTDTSNNPIAGAIVSTGARHTTTDSGGNYLMALQVGTYNATASKYGYLPQTVSVNITLNNTTTQNYALSVAPSTTVSGTVTDASGQGWPLYASIKISGPGYPGSTIYTDPVAGAYSVTLVQGISYTFLVSAVSSGYSTTTTTLALRPADVTQNFLLSVNPATCSAPGYSYPPGTIATGFDSGALPPGWTLVTTSGNPWSVKSADPCGFFVNNTGGSGPFAVANSNCDGLINDNSELRTPSVDMSAVDYPVIRFNQDKDGNEPYLGDDADVDISTDGGTSWTNVLHQTYSVPGPNLQNIDISSIAALQPDVRARFHYYNAFFTWWWAVDNVLLGDPAAVCGPVTGGLLVGNVRDATSHLGLNGATITNTTSGGSTASFATPNDPNLDDGFYILFSPPGAQTLDAAYPLHSDDIQTPTVVAGTVMKQDFNLGVGQLTATPSPLNMYLPPGGTGSLTLTMGNTGTGSGSFNIIEINVPLLTRPVIRRGPYADPEKVREALERLPKGETRPGSDTKNLSPLPNWPPAAPLLPAGEVYNIFPSAPMTYPWGIAFDTNKTDIWPGDLPVPYGGTDRLYRFLTDGTYTGDQINNSGIHTSGGYAGDAAFNPKTGMLWQVDVDYPTGCIWEMNPNTKVVTGKKICPALSTPERGLAYDTLTDTWYTGSWTNGVINHFDSTGTVLDSASVSLPISGLAFSVAGHLLVMTNHAPGSGSDVYVLDPANGYAILGQFNITQNGNPIMSQYGGAGLELDCAGHLWLVDQNPFGGGHGPIIEADSGEAGAAGCDIPWVSENPTTGLVDVGATVPVAVSFTAKVNGVDLTPGWLGAQLGILTNTPFAVPSVGVNLTVTFADVPQGSFADNFIYGLAGSAITAGCGGGNYCPDASVTRAQMAVFIERAVHGPKFVPPGGLYYFVDVLPGSFGGDFINQAFVDSIVGGCSDNPRYYCPNDNVTRAQMAVFIEKGINGPAFVPPACKGIFADVPCPGTYTNYVEALHNDGIAAGCDATHYCPDDPVSRAQMAVFIVTGFKIPYLH